MIVNCKECGWQPCICGQDNRWDAHCMNCDNTIESIAQSELEAIDRWNTLNIADKGG